MGQGRPRQQHPHRLTGARALALVLALACGAAGAQPAPPPGPPSIGQLGRDSVWVPTPERMIRRLLQLADTTPADLVMDLGSGDGRIPIHAARHFGARAVGVELEQNLIEVSRAAARAQGVAHLARFLEQDLFEADLSAATVIALYISPPVMTRLKPRLLALRPGTRVVSHHFTLEDWEPDETVRVEGRSGYLWVVPADAAGRWRVRIEGGDELVLHLAQFHQRLEARGERAGRPVPILGARLRGTEISFSSFDADGHTRQFEGRIDGDRIAGASSGPAVEARRWNAAREPR